MPTTRPACARVVDGLAVYELGSGPPVLLVPNPQGMVTTSSSESPLANVLLRSNTVITFDPPGAFRSDRPPELGLAEMVGCIDEAAARTGLAAPFDLVGHSQATLVALAFALERPTVVRRLVLVGAVDGGWRTTRRARGMPWCWSVFDRRFWEFGLLALPLLAGRARRTALERFEHFVVRESFVDPTLAPVFDVRAGDLQGPSPRRVRWQRAVGSVDLRPDLRRIEAPTLVCVGRGDPQTPWRSNAEIAAALPRGQLVLFDRSGHHPFVEEPDAFRFALDSFWDRC